MQKEYVQETKSSDSPFHTQDILLQSQNNEINQYNICSGKVDTERISNQNSNKQRRQYSNRLSIAKQKIIVDSDC